jgi:hypothetical protein
VVFVVFPFRRKTYKVGLQQAAVRSPRLNGPRKRCFFLFLFLRPKATETRDERWSASGSVIYALRMAQTICVCIFMFQCSALVFICPRVPAACVLVESDVDQCTETGFVGS